ncbi:MAG: OmpA family protein [Deltaproteobacteria bacterium]|nr:OmpA family protein [Deltaproteobacteria bacterium]MCW5803968.1 OmpA family protein [Deltaproteobacteria bacterium]
MRILPSILLGAAALACGCKKQVSTSSTMPPPPTTAEAEPMPPAAEEEPETEPVVAEEPKNIEIQKNVIRLKRGIRIQFETNKAELLPVSNEILDEVAAVMSQNEKIRVRVEGHTDNVGQADYNKTLSDQRAASVQTYLVNKGIAQDRLEATGCGQGTPVADNNTDDGKAENRRVEFVILRRRRAVAPCQLYKPGEHRRHKDHKDHGDAAPPANP